MPVEAIATLTYASRCFVTAMPAQCAAPAIVATRVFRMVEMLIEAAIQEV